ncbi:MAG: SO_0444 family Cu/Zn efflux transporter [Chitinivibrionales bacterium]|nr:SO_0444 family Cu/Zn efflux transporter [Chitinivibrionales bacterium]
MLDLIHEIVRTFLDMAPYLLLGLTFAGVLHVLFRREFILRHLGRRNFWSVFKAALLGVPLPLCSCGVIPTALSLRKSSASNGATMSFLISTPQTGVDSLIATYGMLGPVFAVFRPVAALFMGIFGGITANYFSGLRKQPAEQNKKNEGCHLCEDTGLHSHSISQKISGMLRYAYGEFLDDISFQLVLGIIISGVISWLIPPDFFGKYVGAGLLSMLIMIVGGIPLYVCATASIPIAVALMEKGLSPGAAFVFLAVGPATNAASITLIANVMGRKMLAVYLSTIAVLSIGAGYALNYVFSLVQETGYNPYHHVHASGTSLHGLFFSVVFLILLVLSLVRKFLPRLWSAGLRTLKLKGNSSTGEFSTIMQIEGMTCHRCAAHVAEELKKVPGISSADVDLHEKQARLTGAFSRNKAEQAIADAGYSVGKE